MEPRLSIKQEFLRQVECVECLSDMLILGSLLCFQPHHPSEALSPQVSACLSVPPSLLLLTIELPKGTGVPSFDRTTAAGSSAPNPPHLYMENVVSVHFPSELYKNRFVCFQR